MQHEWKERWIIMINYVMMMMMIVRIKFQKKKTLNNIFLSFLVCLENKKKYLKKKNI